MCATSAAWPMSPDGMRSRMAWRVATVKERVMAVSMKPGQTQCTRMEREASSSASEAVNPCKPDLLAAYTL